MELDIGDYITYREVECHGHKTCVKQSVKYPILSSRCYAYITEVDRENWSTYDVSDVRRHVLHKRAARRYGFNMFRTFGNKIWK